VGTCLVVGTHTVLYSYTCNVGTPLYSRIRWLKPKLLFPPDFKLLCITDHTHFMHVHLLTQPGWLYAHTYIHTKMPNTGTNLTLWAMMLGLWRVGCLFTSKMSPFFKWRNTWGKTCGKTLAKTTAWVRSAIREREIMLRLRFRAWLS